jgi:lysophospholipase L1-like esterase
MISAQELTLKLRTTTVTAKPHALHGKTAQTLLCFVVLAVLPYCFPALSRYRVLVPDSVLSLFHSSGEATVSAATITAPTPATNQTAAGQTQSTQPQPTVQPGEIEDPSGQALARFFAVMQTAETNGGQVRISHYGDSPITNDGITATVRRRLQERFGDAGHGFILAAKPWGWYQHEGVVHEARGWQSNPMWISRGDHLFGFGGASFTASTSDAYATFSTTTSGAQGRTVSAFDIHYLAQPGGGELWLQVDEQPYERLSTASVAPRSGFHQIKVTPGAHKLTLRPVGNGEVRLFGVVLDSGAPGVQYDSLGVNGAFVGLLAHYLDEPHWIEQLRHRQPDLVILAYGANESEYENWPMEQYEQDTREVVRRIRAALPDVSILFVAPMDRGQRGPGGTIITRPMIPKLAAAQRRLAAETGCAFFDTFTAMGGAGTVARWREAKPRLMGGDYLHPTAEGAEIVGTLLHAALLKAYETGKPNAVAAGQ